MHRLLTTIKQQSEDNRFVIEDVNKFLRLWRGINKIKIMPNKVQIRIMEDIVNRAEELTSVSASYIRDRSRQRDAADVRALCISVIKQQYPFIPHTAIAGYFGIDHSAVSYSLKKSEVLREIDRKFLKLYNDLLVETDQEITKN